MLRAQFGNGTAELEAQISHGASKAEVWTDSAGVVIGRHNFERESLSESEKKIIVAFDRETGAGILAQGGRVREGKWKRLRHLVLPR